MKNNIERKLYFLIRDKLKENFDRTDVQSQYTIINKDIALLKEKYIKNISYVSGRLKEYMQVYVYLTFTSYGVIIETKPLHQQKYISRTHLVNRWGGFGRELMRIFLPQADKIVCKTSNPTHYYLVSRIEKVEKSAAYINYCNMLAENRMMKHIINKK